MGFLEFRSGVVAWKLETTCTYVCVCARTCAGGKETCLGKWTWAKGQTHILWILGRFLPLEVPSQHNDSQRILLSWLEGQCFLSHCHLGAPPEGSAFFGLSCHDGQAHTLYYITLPPLSLRSLQEPYWSKPFSQTSNSHPIDPPT